MKTGKVFIGDHCGISNSALFCFQEIQIGNYVMIGGGCKIYDSDFHSLILENRISILDTDIKSRTVNIKEGAFIGAHSIILKGTTIGKKSIIGAGSVVSGVIPDGEVWAGNPAKFIRKV